MNKDSIAFPRWFTFTLTLMIFIPLLEGCSAGAVASKSVSYAVSKYCEVPEAGRKAVRKAVSRAVSPDSIMIRCAAD
jgi:hypothetical protein